MKQDHYRNAIHQHDCDMQHRLSDKRDMVLNAIRLHCAQQKIPPTLKELQKILGWPSASNLSPYLGALVELGYISRKSSLSRNISLISSSHVPVYIQAMGHIKTRSFLLDHNLCKAPPHSMIELTSDTEVAKKGEYLILHRGFHAEKGDYIIKNSFGKFSIFKNKLRYPLSNPTESILVGVINTNIDSTNTY